MFQVIIVLVDNGFMVQVPPPQGGPPQPPRTMVFPDLESAINYTQDIFAQVATGQSEAAEKHAKLLEDAKAETEAAVEVTEEA
jgi:hypothetical protein